MKKTASFLIFLLFPALLAAQNSAVDRLFDKYSGREGVTSVYISSKMFQMFSEMEPDDPEFRAAIRGIRGIRILALESTADGGSRVNFLKELEKELQLKKYEELMVVKEKDQDVKFMVREENGRTAELLLIVGGPENVLISIVGNIDLKSISKLSKSLQIEGLENLENVKEK